jgi:hypothetical protein
LFVCAVAVAAAKKQSAAANAAGKNDDFCTVITSPAEWDLWDL